MNKIPTPPRLDYKLQLYQSNILITLSLNDTSNLPTHRVDLNLYIYILCAYPHYIRLNLGIPTHRTKMRFEDSPLGIRGAQVEGGGQGTNCSHIWVKV